MNSEVDKEKEVAAVNDISKKIVFDSLEALYKIKGEAEHVSAKLEDLQNDTNPHLESYNELKSVKLEPIDMETINKLDKLLTHQTYLQKLLTKKDSFIRKNLLNKNLIFLNQRLRGYLSDLGLPHRVEFTQEMTANISQFGRQLDFGNLSSGQKARVNLALSFSFRHVLQRSLDSVNVCMLDEVLDVGLDSVGVQNAAHMLKRKSREDELTLFIISHRDEGLSNQRARRVNADDFSTFDYVIAMDDSNKRDLLSVCPDGCEDRIHLFLDFAERNETEVPDPYYGQGRGFEIVLNLVEEAADGLLKHIHGNI
mgnify:CR=1 FL=1